MLMSTPLFERHLEKSKWLLGMVMQRPGFLKAESALALRDVHYPTEALRDAWRAVRRAAEQHSDGDTLTVPRVLDHAELANSDLLWACFASGKIAIEKGEDFDALVQDTLSLATAQMRAQQLRNATTNLEQGMPLAHVDGQLIDTIGTTVAQPHIDHDLSAGIDGILSAESLPGIMTGIHWLDNWTGGISKAEVWLLLGRYKGGKTRTLNHMLVQMLLRGHKIVHFAFEGNWRKVLADLLSMLSTHILVQQFGDECRDTFFSGKKLITVGKGWQQAFNERQRYALTAARQQMIAWHEVGMLRVYTREPDHGALKSFDDVRRYWKVEAARGVELFGIDYAQMIRAGRGGIYDDMALLANEMIDVAVSTGTSAILLAQRNEAGNKSAAAREQENFSGTADVKGGGDLPSAADLVMHVSNDIESFREAKQVNQPNALLTLSILMARNYEAGSRSGIKVNRTSGYIIDRPPVSGDGQRQSRFSDL